MAARPPPFTGVVVRRPQSHPIHQAGTNLLFNFQTRYAHEDANQLHNNLAREYNRLLEAYLDTNPGRRKSNYIRMVKPATGGLPQGSLVLVPATEAQIRAIRGLAVPQAVAIWTRLDAFYGLGIGPTTTPAQMEAKWRSFMGLRSRR